MSSVHLPFTTKLTVCVNKKLCVSKIGRKCFIQSGKKWQVKLSTFPATTFTGEVHRSCCKLVIISHA